MKRHSELVIAHPRVVATALGMIMMCASMARTVAFEFGDHVILTAPAQVVISTSLTPGAPHSAVGLHTTISRCSVTPQGELITNTASAVYASGLGPRDIVAQDMDQDGRMDLVISNASSGRVAVLRQDQGGGFGLAYGLNAGSVPMGIASADLNSDGWPDVVTANYGADSVTVLLNDGDGSGSLTKIAELPTGARPIDVALIDLDHDGLADLVCADQFGNSVSVWLNKGGAGFGDREVFAVGSRPQSVVGADFDRDSHMDLAVANGNSGSVTILRGDGVGRFVRAVDLSAGAQPTSLAVEDLNLDGRMDVVVASAGQNLVTVFAGTGDLEFVATHLPTTGRPSSVAILDLNDDPLPDLVIAHADSPRYDLVINASAYPGGDCPGDIDGDLWVSVFDFAIFVTHFAQSTQSLTNGDLNGDAEVDIFDFAILAANYGNQCAPS